MQDAENLLREYYISAKLYLPPEPSRRHYKFVLCNGDFVKIKDRIDTVKKLKSHLVRLAPYRVFCSSAYYLNPTTVGREKEDNAIILYNDMVFDVDFENELDRAKEETKKLWDFLTDLGFNKLILLYTGSRGFHVKIEKWDTELSYLSPKERMDRMKKMRLEMVDLVEDVGIKTDSKISKNIRLTSALPMTVHGKTGNLVEFVDINKIDDFEPNRIINMPSKPMFTYADLRGAFVG